MFVPSSRLLLLATILMVLGLLPVILGPTGWALFSLAFVLLLVLAVLDAVASSKLGADLSLAPFSELRLKRDEAKQLDLVLHNPSKKRREIELGLALPAQLHPDQERLSLAMPAGASKVAIPYTLTPRQRGLFEVRSAHVGCSSRLGLWQIRHQLDCDVVVRVLANLSPVKTAFASLFLNRGDHGANRQRQLGKGREFEQLREYLPGDSSEDVHWKATAKRSEPVTKLYRVERTQDVYVVLDASRLSQQELPNTVDPEAAWPDSIYERYVTAASVLALACDRQGDRFGMGSYSNRLELFIRAKNGQVHQQHCQEALARQHPRAVTPDYEEVLSSLCLQVRHRSLMIFLTDLSDPVAAETFSQHIGLLSRKHHVLVMMIVPDAMQPLFQGNDVASDQEVYARLSGHLQWQTLRQTQLTLKRHGVMLSTATEESLAASVVNRYIQAKQRQLV